MAPDAVELRAGEVIGLAGLLGSGTEPDAAPPVRGRRADARLRPRCAKRRLKSPANAIAAGIGMVPGERRLGLVMNQSVRDNILLPSLGALSHAFWVDRRAGDRIVAELMELLDIRPRRPALPARALSGGNQQKVILAKWLARGVGVLLLDEPTQGIDVAAKAQIHALIRDFAARGGGALIAIRATLASWRALRLRARGAPGTDRRPASIARQGPRRAASCARRSAADMA